MRAYAETEQCRWQYLLNYLGEAYEPPCDRCDNCLQGAPTGAAGGQARGEPPAAGDRPFAEKSWVFHPHWGKGLVARYERNKIVVLFDTAGYKTFLLSAVLESRLLRPIEGATPPGVPPT
jgi:ATP-dependent DNA helicase RecQ